MTYVRVWKKKKKKLADRSGPKFISVTAVLSQVLTGSKMSRQ